MRREGTQLRGGVDITRLRGSIMLRKQAISPPAPRIRTAEEQGVVAGDDIPERDKASVIALKWGFFLQQHGVAALVAL